MQRFSGEVLGILATGVQNIEILQIPQFEDLFLGTKGKQDEPVARIETLMIDRPTLILHSSGK